MIRGEYIKKNILSYFDMIKQMQVLRYNKKYQKLLNLEKNDYVFLYLINTIIKVQNRKMNNKLKNKILFNLTDCFDKYDNCFFYIKYKDTNKYINIITKNCKEYAISYNLKLFLYYKDDSLIKKIRSNSVTSYYRNYIFFFYNEYVKDEYINLSNLFNDDEDLCYFTVLKNQSKYRSTFNMFYNCFNLEKVNLKLLNTENLINVSCMFRHCIKLKDIFFRDNVDLEKVEDASEMFYRCENIKSVNLDLFNLKNVIDMGGMFSCCTSLETIKMTKFNTCNVSNFNYMFENCHNLKEIILGDNNFIINENINVILSNNHLSFEEKYLYKMRMFSNCYELDKNYFIVFEDDKIVNNKIVKLIKKESSLL